LLVASCASLLSDLLATPAALTAATLKPSSQQRRSFSMGSGDEVHAPKFAHNFPVLIRTMPIWITVARSSNQSFGNNETIQKRASGKFRPATSLPDSGRQLLPNRVTSE